MYRFTLILLSIVAGACTRPISIDQMELPSLNGEQIRLDSVLKSKAHTTFMFFSPECPVCLVSVDELKRIDSVYSSLVYVYPGNYYEPEQIRKFHQDYGIGSLAVLDTAKVLVRLLGAEVTPHAIITDQNGSRVYKGAIDDRSPEIGTKKVVITQRYLHDVLDSLSKGAPIARDSTQAHGCYIE